MYRAILLGVSTDCPTVIDRVVARHFLELLLAFHHMAMLAESLEIKQHTPRCTT